MSGAERSGGSSGWVEVSADALQANIAAFRETIGQEVALGVVLKADAYGHGLDQVLPAVHPLVDVLHVVTARDAARVRGWEAARGAARRRVLVLGVVDADEAVALAAAGVEVVVGDRSWRSIAARLAEVGGPTLAVHLHLDSGLGREGFLGEELDEVLGWLHAAGGAIAVVGALTHFADVEDVTEHAYASRQLEVFHAGVARLERGLAALGRPVPLETHTAASAAALVLPGSRCQQVRVGIALYGLWPSRETRLSLRVLGGPAVSLQPVLAWRCRSQAVRWIPAGSFVGYGCTHRCERATRVAVLPVGYFDGYPRLASHRAHVLVGGHRCPVLGRVMMNHLIVDVTDAPGDEEQVTATLIGRDGEEVVTADQLAGWAQTISYEIVARIGGHVPRQLVETAHDPQKFAGPAESG